MAKINKSQSRGRPKEWTDEELKQLALDTKYKYHGKKLTPSLLEKETKVGRNTWSRRLKDYIDELNEPVITDIPLRGNNETILPSVDLIFKKYGNDELALKNELLDLEILLYDFYKELQEYKEKEERYQNGQAEVQSLKDEVAKQRKRTAHYEQLYNNIVVSSVYPHLQGVQGSQISQLNIKDKLIDIEDYKEKSTDLENLSSYFPDVTDESNAENDKSEKQNQNMQKLLDDFDV
ncbi:hypothetical protein H7992_23685 [Sporosarcina sp. resist]|uniref:hypothetical protein n=1 Tax=Sporosarcina sp. resist TaxID=2762563 RepID=UPI00164DD182|nr:hypothetical protein [Sporosarcina sp. resist]QNK88104.1 hypothetical protein H7992_23685 [Sporosarcina sp. resist]